MNEQTDGVELEAIFSMWYFNFSNGKQRIFKINWVNAMSAVSPFTNMVLLKSQHV